MRASIAGRRPRALDWYRLYFRRRRGGGGRRDRCSFCHGAATMLVIGLILSGFGIGLFCWLIFTLAVYALPSFIGLTVGIAAFHSGAGAVGGLFCGITAGALTFVLGRYTFATVPALDPSCLDCCRVCNSGDDRGLLYSSRCVADWNSVFDLARSFRLDRRDPYRQHGMGAYDRSGGAASANKSERPPSVRISGPFPQYSATTRMRRRTNPLAREGSRHRYRRNLWGDAR